MFIQVTRTSLTAVLLGCLTAAVHAQTWGDLEGTIVYKGAAPTPTPIKADKDPAFCGKHMLVDEQIIVNKANGGLANVVVYLFDTAEPMIHPDYEKGPKEVLIDNEKCRFNPHVATLWTKQKLMVGNKDPLGHNTKADFFNNPTSAFNITIPMGEKLVKEF